MLFYTPCAPPYKFSNPARRVAGHASLHPAMMVCNLISIHALREEGDWHGSSSPARPANFYPRPPRGGRQMVIYPITQLSNFYPRPPRGGRRPITLFQ